MIPHSRPTLDRNDEAAVKAVLESGQLAQGKKVRQLENEMASFIGTKAGAAVSSGTAALHLSLLALKIGRGDEVILPSYVCTAPLNAIFFVSAKPIIVDIDPETYNIDADDLKKKITRRTKAIIVPHLFGLPAELDAILALGIPVIEDCAMSLGSRFREMHTGNFGVLSIFSFYATKMISTGEGGMVLSNREDIIQTVRDLRDYDEKEEYSVRYNYKMTDIQAALGISQLKKLPTFIERRKEIAALYTGELKGKGIEVPRVPDGREHVFYRYVVRIRNSSDFMERMRRMGVECRRPVFKPLHHYLGIGGFAASDEAWKRAVSIPIYPSLKYEEISSILESAKAALRG